MFNFFNEVKQGLKEYDISGKYNLVNISGKIIYVEGHKGITTLSKGLVCFKVKNGRISIEGKDLILIELSEDTLKISGEIQKIEVF